jgi:hypothetical protein
MPIYIARLQEQITQLTLRIEQLERDDHVDPVALSDCIAAIMNRRNDS